MLTTICGEDVEKAYQYLLSLKDSYHQKGYQISDIKPTELESAYRNRADELSLFGQPTVFAINNLNSVYSKQKNKRLALLIDEIATHKNIEVINWEEAKSAYELRLKAVGTVKEFKPAASIFQLLDTLYPGNLAPFIKVLHTVHETQEEGFIFAMLAKHTRTLLLAHTNSLPARLPPWQRGKTTTQAKHWNLKQLENFYEGLLRIEISVKTSNNIHGVINSLDILACYYL